MFFEFASEDSVRDIVRKTRKKKQTSYVFGHYLMHIVFLSDNRIFMK